MYKLKKIFALFLAIVLATSFSTVAFAAEDESGIPENATKHTIEVTVEPGETFDGSEDGITPYMWGNGTYNPPISGATYTASFSVNEKYFAYEATATTSNTNVSGDCNVILMLNDAVTSIASLYVPVNSTDSPAKNDWITLYDTNYLFKITNNTNSALSVEITYYSWN